MGAEIKGYLVRAKDGAGNMAGSSTRSTLGGAARALDVLAATGCTDVAIFRVRDDGTEERLPSYEEALGALSILRDEVTLAQDHKRGGMSCGGPPLLWTCPPSALTSAPNRCPVSCAMARRSTST